MLTITATELPRLMTCIGSRLMTQPHPTVESDTTLRDEGNAADYIAQQVFSGAFSLEELIDRKAPNGVFITAEMAEDVEGYLEFIKHDGSPANQHMEYECSHGIPGKYQVNGRADCATHVISANHLFIDDLKYGWSIVEPFENWILLSHAMGYCIHHRITPAQITMSIYQPRPYHRDGAARSWTVSYDELMTYWNRLNHQLCNPTDELQTSDHCKRCVFQYPCPANRKAGYNSVDVSDRVFNETLTGDELSHEIITLQRAKHRLDNRLKAIEEHAMHKIKNAQIVPGFTTEKRQARERWNDGVTVEVLEAMTGKKLSKTVAFTPAQVRKAGVSKAVVKSMADKPDTGLKLVRINAHEKAQKIFG